MEKNIVVPSLENFKNKKKKLMQAGKNTLNILSDFDRTLTKAFVNGEKFSSIISIIRRNSYLGEDYSKKAYELFKKYHPIETDPNIPYKEKIEKMNEWWEAHYKLLKEKGMNKNILRKIVKSNKIEFREGIEEFLDILNGKDIPLIILSSSGIGNCIEMLFDKMGKNYKNVHIISNFIKFDQRGKMSGVEGKIIHPFNKNQSSLKCLPIHNELKKRKNLILLGDSLGDPGMVEGFEYKNVIKIGFFNYPTEDAFERYKEKFDVLLLNDCDMDYINRTIKEITEQKV